VLELHARGPNVERAEERRVVVLERDVAASERAHDDHLRVAGVEHLFGGDELHFHRLPYDSVSVLDFSSTDSTPPTLKNACSGTWSSSPLFSASKDSTVSLMGTWMPGKPV